MCVSVFLKTLPHPPGERKLATSGEAGTPAAPWIRRDDLLTAMPPPESSLAELRYLTAYARTLYEFQWPSAFALQTNPRSESRTIAKGRPFVAMAPNAPDENRFWMSDFDGPRSAEGCWPGVTGLLLDLFGTLESPSWYESQHLPRVLTCLHMNDFTTCRVDASTVVAGRETLTMILSIAPGDIVRDCRLVDPRVALQVAARAAKPNIESAFAQLPLDAIPARELVSEVELMWASGPYSHEEPGSAQPSGLPALSSANSILWTRLPRKKNASPNLSCGLLPDPRPEWLPASMVDWLATDSNWLVTGPEPESSTLDPRS